MKPNFTIIKKNLLLAIALCVLSVTGAYAQLITTSRMTIGNTPIYHKVTGEQITPEAFRDIISVTPRVTLHNIIDERGEISALIYDPAGGFKTIDIETRVKPNEPFPKFIFKTTDDVEIASDELQGQVVILYFNLLLEDRFMKQNAFSEFERTINSSPVKNTAVPIILTNSSLENAAAFLKNATLPYPLVANAQNFTEKFKVVNYPAFIVIKRDGTLAAYGTDLDELKSILSKLKN